MSKPTIYPDWALNDVTETRSGKSLPNKIQIPDAYKNAGTLDGLVPLQYFNEQNNLLGKWVRFFDTLSPASNIKIVNSLVDLPTPSGGEIALEPIQYLFNEFVDIEANSFRLPASGSVFFTFTTLNAGIINNTVPLFVGSDFSSFVAEKGVFLSIGSSGYFDLDNGGQVFLFDSIFASGNLGTVKCDTFNSKFCNFFDYSTGFVFADRTDLVPRTQIAIIETGFVFSQNAATTIIDVSGSVVSTFIEKSSSEVQSNETLFNFDESIKDFGGQIVVNGFTLLSQDGTIFAANSLSQSYINAVFNGNIGLADSTSKLKLTLVGNSAFTTIAGISTNTPINVNVDYILKSFERFLLQDVCTFDSALDTVNTTFTNGLALNDRVFLNAYSGSTLPTGLDATTEYYVVSPAVTSFKLSLTPSGTAIDFTTNGAGVLNYRHAKVGAISRSAEAIYIGIEPVTVVVGGWLVMTNIDASDNKMRGVIMKISNTGIITEEQPASQASTDNTKPQSSIIQDLVEVPLNTGDGLVVYHRNDSIIENIASSEILLTIND